MQNTENLFFTTLKDIFIGAEINGVSGFINLMRIKSKYFNIFFNALKEEINDKIQEFPEFKEELFQKLYNFFKRYFSETGASYFKSTPFDAKIYEKIYTDNRDVVLFWKTHMLYYIKTDILLRNMEIILNDVKFFFDVTELEDKKGWEKRNLVYKLKNIKKKAEITFIVNYSYKGRKTNIRNILKALKKEGVTKATEEVLIKAFSIFEKQAQIDYFINKNMKLFLKEQFDFWLYQYIYLDESQFNEKRIRQLKVLQQIAYRIIDFISQFENELLKIWYKPKFVLNSNYIITFDRIISRKGGINFIKKLFQHEGIKLQIAEWKELKLVPKDDNPSIVLKALFSESKSLKKIKFLPIDSRYFKDMEYEFLSLFDDGLDKALDGWLIESENWQALNTILKKFKNKIKLIYIDPPFNTGTNNFTMYINRFLDSAWITMMDNRLSLSRKFLKENGSIYVRIDYHGTHYTRFLLDEIFGPENFRNEITIKRTEGKSRIEGESYSIGTESLFFYTKNNKGGVTIPIKKTTLFEYSQEFLSKLKKINSNLTEEVEKISNEIFWLDLDHRPGERSTSSQITVFGMNFKAPKGRHWLLSQKRIDSAIKDNKVRLFCLNCNRTSQEELITSYSNCKSHDFKVQIYYNEESVTTNWTDIQSYSQSNFMGKKFPTENSEILLKRIIESASKRGDLVMDYFLGSGTSIAAAHKMGRKWIGVEMGEQFYDIIIPRMKLVLAGKQTGISKDINWEGGGFFKYYELEQFEETLKRIRFEENESLIENSETLSTDYIFLPDLKLLDSLILEYNKNRVKVDLSRLYSNIDIGETLSNLFGQNIKQIQYNGLVFENEEKIDLENLDSSLIKPLIWWGDV